MMMSVRPTGMSPIRVTISALALFAVISGGTAFGAVTVDALDLMATVDRSALPLSAATPIIASALRRRRGRPRKFAAPSRAVTLTLPNAVLETLALVHPDPSRAIVQLAKQRVPRSGRPAAELAVFGHRAVITIRPTAALEQRAGIELVPLPDGRALISFDQPKTIADLELLLQDALEDQKLDPADRKVFEGISAILKEARRSSDVTLLRRSIIVLEAARTPRRAADRTRRRTGS